MMYLPVDHLEQIVVAGKFQKYSVASGPVQIFTRNFSILVELTGTIEWFLQAELYTIGAIMHTWSWLLCWDMQGKSPSAYISAIYSTLAV